MTVLKITTGFFIQEFDEKSGELLDNRFITSDDVQYENEDGENIEHGIDIKKYYAPFYFKKD